MVCVCVQMFRLVKIIIDDTVYSHKFFVTKCFEQLFSAEKKKTEKRKAI